MSNDPLDSLNEKYREKMPENQPEAVVKIFYSFKKLELEGGIWLYHLCWALFIILINVLLYFWLRAIMIPAIGSTSTLVIGSALIQEYNKRVVAAKRGYAFALTSYGNIYILDSRICRWNGADTRLTSSAEEEPTFSGTMQFYDCMRRDDIVNFVNCDINGAKSLRETMDNKFCAVKCNSIKVLEKKKKETVVEYWDEKNRRFGTASIGAYIYEYEELLELIETMDLRTRKEYVHRHYPLPKEKQFTIKVEKVLPDNYKLILSGKVDGVLEKSMVGFLKVPDMPLKAIAFEDIKSKGSLCYKAENEEVSVIVQPNGRTDIYQNADFEIVSIDQVI